MADNIKKRTFEIEITGVKESVTSLSTLEKVLERMEKTVESINSKGGFSIVSKEANKNTKEAIDLAKAEEIAQGKVISSYKDKQTAMRALGKEIKSMTAADNEAVKKQKEMISQYNDLNNQLKSFDASMGNHQRNVGNYSSALKDAKEELKEIKAQMVGLDQFSAEYAELAKRGGEVADKMGDINEAIKRQASDTKGLDAVIDYAKSATAAFTLYKGAMSAFGVETKEAEKAMQELLGAMSIIQSLQQLSESFQSTSATGKLLHKTLQMVGLESKTAAASTTALATAENVADAATKKVNLSLKATRLMLASLGIGLVILAVTTLVEHWEDLCGWFDKSFPIFKKCGGIFNTLKGVVIGLGKAVIQWITNPWKTVFEMFQKALSGDFAGAIKAGIDGIKNQFVGVADAFKEGFQGQVEKGLEEMTLKTVEETNKQTQQQLKELKIQERNNKTYSDKYINLQKKDFAERKKLAKGNKEELNKIKLEEMQFFADVEDKKTSAAKAGAKEREKAAKEAAQKAKEFAKQVAEAEKDLSNAAFNRFNIEIKELIRQNGLEIEKYSEGPMNKLIEQVNILQGLQNKLFEAEKYKAFEDLYNGLDETFKKIYKSVDDLVKHEGYLSLEQYELQEQIENSLSGEELDLFLTKLETFQNNVRGIVLNFQNNLRISQEDATKKVNDSIHKNISAISKDIDKVYDDLIDKVSKYNLEPVRDNIFGIINEEKTLKKLENAKTEWIIAYEEINKLIHEATIRWDEYIDGLEKLYTKDSQKYKDALIEKEKALQHFYDLQAKLEQRAATPTSGSNDYNADGNSDIPKPKRKLWYGKGDKKQDGSEYSLIENLSNMFQSLDEMVLAPAMDTFSMFMDFAIEETQQRLEEVEKMHDDALDKVEESADKIAELNASLKDSSNDNMEVTKQQLADEQLLYAQRLAEEQKLAEQEKALKNKAAKQEANARKMELRYQMVMGIANTAQGASKALATWGWPLGPIFAAVMAALGAVQVAMIAKQIGQIQPVKYAEGGLLSGPAHSNGGIKVGNTGVEVEGNEYVVNKRSTAKYLPLLEAINAEGNRRPFSNPDKKIRKYANGGTLNFDKTDENLRQRNDTNRLINAIDGIDMQPVVAVKDIWRAEDRLVKVRSLAGR